MKKVFSFLFILSTLNVFSQKKSISIWVEPKYTTHSHYENYFYSGPWGPYSRKESSVINFAAGISKKVILKKGISFITGLQLDDKGYKYEGHQILPTDGSAFVKKNLHLWFLGIPALIELPLPGNKSFFISGGIIPEVSVSYDGNNYKKILLSSNISAGYRIIIDKREVFIKTSYRYTFSDLYTKKSTYSPRHIQSIGIAAGINLF